jgi:DNA polymerase-3 subunit delta'
MDLFGDDIIEEDFDTDEDGDIEESLEPAEGLKPPRSSFISLGHTDVEKQLLEFHAANRMPHGLIFSGLEGIGKATFAYRFARFLLKHGSTDLNQDSLFSAPAALTSFDVSPEDPVFRRVASGGHPDLMTIERAYDAVKGKTKDSVDVNEIRKVPQFLRMTASDGGWRVVIIDDADTMNRNAQNALLKILEEPPPRAILILITHRLGALIPTIRSRAHVINFQPLGPETIAELIAAQGHRLGASETATISRLAGGSAGKTIASIEQGGLDTLSRVMTAFEQYPQWNWAELHNLANDLGAYGRENAYYAYTEILQNLFTRLATAKARGTNLESEMEPLSDLWRNSSLDRLLKICENLQSHFGKADVANLDKRQAVLSAFSIIAA